ncbi:hypothetical protein TCDM_12322 [Trypanosoma cruzi Dm28c]|uniref:Uncharacterized protein n=1 Tax=Trypanosoma cruzi Dm28c TaxID=1416333 RepID=V5CUJ6_TRYCR|nr:hypothetical protein TCDM_12322 [Trypanosoma cruzi Dm28c]
MQNKLISDVEISIEPLLISRCFETIPAQLPAPSFSPHCPSATANKSSPTLTRPGTRSEVILLPSSNSFQLANDIGVVPLKKSTAALACSTAASPPVPQHIIIITTTRSSTVESNTRRDMLGLCGSLSPPSLLLPLDPVTPRRLCVRGAFTAAATRESIQICVGGRCVCCCSFSAFESHSSVSRLFAFLPSVCLCSTCGKRKKWQYIRHVRGEQSRAPMRRAGHKRIQKEQRGAPPPTPALTHKHTHTNRSAARPRVGGFGPPHKKRAHRPHSPTMDEEKRHTATASSSISWPTGYGHGPAANTQRSRCQ